MPLIIRKATIDDAYALAVILADSWLAAYYHILSPEELTFHANIERRYEMFRTKLANPEGEFYIAIHNDTPCGHFMFCDSRDPDRPDDCEIVAIYAVPEYWNTGVGRQMMTFALRRIKDLNYENVLLWVFKENARARRFYEKFGFISDGTEKPAPFRNSALEIRYILHLDQAVMSL
jgi:RimJ/RimL family protein N-acetyltransferase